MSGETSNEPNIGENTNTAQGSSNFNDLIKSPEFQKYLMSMGAGMMNKPTFSSAMNSGLAAGGQAMAGIMEKKAEQQSKIEEQKKQMEMIRELLRQYTGGDDLAGLIGGTDFSNVQRNIGRK